MRKIVLLLVTSIIVLASCKKKKDDPAPSSGLAITTQGSYEEQFLTNTDTIDIVFAASGKDYTVEYLGEKRVYYPAYDSTMILCNPLTYNAFFPKESITTFQVANGATMVQKIVFKPMSFSFQISNFTLDCSSGTCVPMMSCITQNSNGIGSFKSLIQFKVDGVIRNVEVTATSKQNVVIFL